MLTDPNDDRRTWFWAHFYADGEGVLTASPTPDPMREVVASNRICAIGKYVGLGPAPWDGVTGATHLLVHEPHEREWPGQPLGRALDALHVQLLRLHTIDFHGFDPSTLTDLFYTFSGCNKLTTILADASWALPSSGITGSQCFYSCSTSLVGGNGTAWASNKTAYTYFHIGTASTPEYITVA